MLLDNFFGHLRTVLHHKNLVLKYCFRAGLYWQGIVHDLSKFSPVEFVPGVLFFQGTRSPNEREREEYGCSKAWMHHKGRNRHHFEYWTDYNPKTKLMEPVKMPDIYIYEMFCDRLAASKTYNKDSFKNDMPLRYFLRSKGTRVIEKSTSDKLERLLVMLAEKGENYVFRYIRSQVKKLRAAGLD